VITDLEWLNYKSASTCQARVISNSVRSKFGDLNSPHHRKPRVKPDTAGPVLPTNGNHGFAAGSSGVLRVIRIGIIGRIRVRSRGSTHPKAAADVSRRLRQACMNTPILDGALLAPSSVQSSGVIDVDSYFGSVSEVFREVIVCLDIYSPRIPF